MPGQSEAGSDTLPSRSPETSVVSGPNPFPGPRPFAGDDRGWFFGRDQELADLVALLFAHRAILLHAPSGAGKTSLVNAGLIPRARERGFEFLPVARVRGTGTRRPDDPDERREGNRFVRNLLENWRAGGLEVPSSAPTLIAALDALPEADDPGRVVVLDQFEELFVLHPDCWRDRGDLFSQVQAALDHDQHLHFLFVLRDDYLAALEALTPRLRDRLSARFHLRGLSSTQALAAIVRPIEASGRRFAPGVAEDLVRALRQQPAELPGTLSYEGEEVEPVQLQIVCRAFVERLPGDVKEISAEHVARYADVHQALVGFYEQALAAAVKGRAGGRERPVRLWFERQLITPAHTRGLVFQGDRTTAGLSNDIVDELERQRIVQSEPRGPALWYELTHDRLIDAVLASNRVWYAKRARTVTRRALVAGAVVAVVAVVAALLAIHQGGSGSASSAPKPITGQITDTARTIEFPVHGRALQLLSALMSPDSGFQGQLKLFDPAGRSLEQVSRPGSAQILISYTLPASGRYRVEVSGRGGSTGSFDLALAVQNRGAQRALNPPHPYTGTLDAAHQVDTYTFAGQAGSLAQIMTTGVYGTLLVEGPSGEAFTPVEYISGATLIEAVLPEDGSYQLFMSSPTNATGPYNVQVQLSKQNGDEPAPFSGFLDNVNEVVVHRLQSRVGGLLTVGYANPSETISLRSADGRRLIDNVDDTGKFIWPIAPGVTYILVVYADISPSSNGVAYSIAATLRHPAPLPTGSTSGQIRSKDQVDIYAERLTQGAEVHLLVKPSEQQFDPQVTVLQPDGTKLLDNFTTDPGRPIEEGGIVHESGCYLIFVSSADSSLGHYGLTATRAPACAG
jgi:hypothetical protein